MCSKHSNIAIAKKLRKKSNLKVKNVTDGFASKQKLKRGVLFFYQKLDR
jgi:hypothetical protein